MNLFFKKILLFLVFCSVFSIYANQYYSNLYLLEEHLQTRVGSIYLYKENFKSAISRKEQTLLIFGEYKFLNFYSLYLGIPYTWKWVENSQKRQYLDFIRIVNKFQFSSKWFNFYTGILFDLPRNHNKAGDVPEDLGFVELYFGLGYFYSSFIAKISVHWNTQTNQKFKEKTNQEFEKKWLLNASFGYKIKNLFFWIESQYQKIYDPKQSKAEYFLYGPSFGYELYSFQISFLYLFYPKDSLYDKEIRLLLQKSIDF